MSRKKPPCLLVEQDKKIAESTEWYKTLLMQAEEQRRRTEIFADLVDAYEVLRRKDLVRMNNSRGRPMFGVVECSEEVSKMQSTLAQKSRQIESQQSLLNDLQSQLSVKEIEVRDLSSRLTTTIQQAKQLQTQLETTHKLLEEKQLEIVQLKSDLKTFENIEDVNVVPLNPVLVEPPRSDLTAVLPRKVVRSVQLTKSVVPPNLITCSRGGMIVVGTRRVHCFNAMSGNTVCEFDVPGSSSASVMSTGVSPENDLALIGTSESQLGLVEIMTGRVLKDLKGHTGKIKGCGFLGSKTKGFSVSTDRTIKLWDLNRASPIRSVPVTSQLIGGVSSFDGNVIVSCHQNGKVIVWSLNEKICEVDAHSDSCLGVALSPDGRFITSVGKEDTVAVIDVHMAQAGPVHRLTGFKALTTDGPPAVSRDSKIVSVCGNGAIYSWDMLLGSLLGSMATDAVGLAWAGESLGVPESNQHLVSSHSNGTVKWWTP